MDGEPAEGSGMKPLSAFEKRRVMYWISNWLHSPDLYGDEHMTAVLGQVQDDDRSVRIIRLARIILRLSREPLNKQERLYVARRIRWSHRIIYPDGGVVINVSNLKRRAILDRLAFDVVRLGNEASD